MARQVIRHRSSVAVELPYPTDEVASPRNPLDNTNDGATATFKVYDAAKDEEFSTAEASGQTEWSVTNAGNFEVGDTVEATHDTGSITEGAITAVDGAAGTITVDTALGSDAAAGNRVRVRLGNAIAMSEYGTASLATTDWGFRGFIPPDHPGLEPGMEVDVEINFVGAVGGGLDMIEVICAVVEEVEDCD